MLVIICKFRVFLLYFNISVIGNIGFIIVYVREAMVYLIRNKTLYLYFY